MRGLWCIVRHDASRIRMNSSRMTQRSRFRTRGARAWLGGGWVDHTNTLAASPPQTPAGQVSSCSVVPASPVEVGSNQPANDTMPRPSSPRITRKLNRCLRCILTRDELLAAGKRQAEKAIELVQIEAERKRSADQFKAMSSAAEAELSSLAAKVSTGCEFRSVECTAVLGEPDAAHKTLVRDDTNEVVGVEEMTVDDRQTELLPAPTAP